MSNTPLCSRCGAPLTAKSQGRVCWLCLGHGMLGVEPEQATLSEGPGSLIGRYKLLQQIGEGGCGTVFLAEQEVPLRRRVALKIIKLGMDTKAVIGRFEAERQALALMDHPNIAKVLDAGATDSGRPYFVMELVRGIKITDYCDQNHLTTRQRLDLFIPVCQAIQHAHQKGIIHRDIKPSNILVTLNDGAPAPKVIDFGIAKATAGKLTDHTVFTAAEQFLGTPAYMSPEQAELTSLDIDTRSDIYSLGILLYELLAGSTPFTTGELLAQGIEAMRKMIREREPARPSRRLSTMASAESTTAAERRATDPVRLAGQLQGDLDWIVLKCLEKDRTRRYETANGLAADLRRHLNDEPVVACPPSLGYQVRKAVRRHRLIFSAVTVVLVSLVAGIGVSTRQTFVARKAQRGMEAAIGRETLANEVLRAQIEETKKATRLAEEQKERAEAGFQLLQLQKAEDLFGADQAALAVNYLGRVLRSNPANEIAAARLASAMLRRFPNELTKPLQHKWTVNSAQFSPNGLWVATASGDGTAQVWDARTGEPLHAPLRHAKGVNSAQFSPDGSQLVTACDNGTAQVWDARTGTAVGLPFRHSGKITTAQFSPGGGRVVTASDDGTARVWDARNGRAVTGLIRTKAAIRLAEFSPDGLRLLTGSQDASAQVWDVATGLALGHPLPNTGYLWSAQFSPDGLLVLTTDDQYGAELWDPATGQQATKAFRQSGLVHCARFSPDRLHVVTGANDSTARIWDAYTGEEVTRPLRHDSWVHEARFSPDGLRVVTAAANMARVWDARTGEPLSEPLRHNRKVLTAQFSPDGLRLVTTCEDMTARIWDVGGATALAEPLRHAGFVMGAQFSHDGLRLVTACANGTARVWDAHSGQPLTQFFPPAGSNTAGKFSARFSPDGLRVVTGSSDGTARVWDAVTGQSLTPPLRHQRDLWSAEFSHDGKRVVTASGDSTAQVWDAVTGLAMFEPLRHQSWVMAARFSPDDSMVITASWDNSARVWDAHNGNAVSGPLLHQDHIVKAQFRWDGRRVVTAALDSTARVWDVPTGQPVTLPMRHGDQVNCAAFSPDGLMVVTGSWDKTAQVWDAETGRPNGEPIRHAGPVRTAEFSPNGLRVVTGSEDRTARIWDARTSQPLTEPLGHEGEVNAAEFSPDGSRVATASSDGTARVWEVAPPPKPVPSWFLEWAASRVGYQFGTNRDEGAVRFEEQRRCRELVESQTETNYYTRLARWVESDPARRMISPWAVVPMPEHVRRLLEVNAPASLREVLALAPATALAWGRLALLLAGEAGEASDRDERLVEAEWDAQRALKLAPDQEEARQALEKLRSLGHEPRTKGLIPEPLTPPSEEEVWEEKGDALERAQHPSEALAAYEHLLALLPGTNAPPGSPRLRALKKHAALCQQMGRAADALADICAFGIMARAEGTSAQMLDLSAYYNAGFVGEWNEDGYSGNDLAELPKGVQNFAGTRYDVRGLIQLCGAKNLTNGSQAFPAKVDGIPVGLKGDHIRFLTGVLWGSAPAAVQIGTFVIHYADGRVAERPIVLHQDVVEWHDPLPEGLAGKPVVAWRGPNAFLRGRRPKNPNVQLYVITWDNPRPETAIASLDFVAALVKPKPFLVAVTVE